MENTLENKAKFFCQYWMQNIVQDGLNSTDLCTVNFAISEDIYKEGWLLLKPLSSISDEDAIEVAKIALGHQKFTQQIRISETSDRSKGFGFSFWLNGESEYQIDLGNFYNPKLFCLNRSTSPSEYLHNVLKISDYLRSRGYALPWMGLSVEQLISYGWIKLKDNPQNHFTNDNNNK